MLVVLLWQVNFETVTYPERERALRPNQAAADVLDVEPSKEVPGASNVTLRFTDAAGTAHSVVARNTVGPAPAVGDAWPAGVRYDPRKPQEAAARPPVVFWVRRRPLARAGAARDDVAVMLALAVAVLAYLEYERQHPVRAVAVPRVRRRPASDESAPIASVLEDVQRGRNPLSKRTARRFARKGKRCTVM